MRFVIFSETWKVLVEELDKVETTSSMVKDVLIFILLLPIVLIAQIIFWIRPKKEGEER